MASRNILLVEPRYPTKFPPLGLMKLSTYHKALGDRVHFVKGTDKDVPYEYWDRVYITTLFTYHWKITLEDILYYKSMLHGDTSRIYIGGIMASLMPDKLWKETGISPITGILDIRWPRHLTESAMHIIIFGGIKSMIKEIDTFLKGYVLPIAGRHVFFL